MKKIYFACSIRGGREDQPYYQQLVDIIKQKAEVLSEIFGDKKLTSEGHTHLQDDEIRSRDLNWIQESDGLICEITNPSLGVGYEIGKAEEWGKPILALYRPHPDKRLSAMIAGSDKIVVAEYFSLIEATEAIDNFLAGI